jgi:carbon storage regulator
MLVLSRNKGETVMIGEHAEITIKVLKVHGKQVHLGIVAPKQLPVHREEVYLRIQKTVEFTCESE